VCVSPFVVASIVGHGAAATNAAAAVVVAVLMGAGGAQKRPLLEQFFYFTYPPPLVKPPYEVNWKAQALEAAQSAATPSLSEGSTRLLHDIVLGIVTSHDVTIGKFAGRRRRAASGTMTSHLGNSLGAAAAATAATMASPPPSSSSSKDWGSVSIRSIPRVSRKIPS
jgi:hypothetical protein